MKRFNSSMLSLEEVEKYSMQPKNDCKNPHLLDVLSMQVTIVFLVSLKCVFGFASRKGLLRILLSLPHKQIVSL